MKTCPKCGEAKPLDAFSPFIRNRDGLFGWCKNCKNTATRERRAENPGRVRAQEAKSRRKDPEKAAAARRKLYRANPEKAIARNAVWVRANPEKSAAKTMTRRARQRNAPGRGVTGTQWLAILAAANGICTYCEKPGKLTMDHIVPLALGGAHDIDNIAAACGSCNSSKGDTLLPIWLARAS